MQQYILFGLGYYPDKMEVEERLRSYTTDTSVTGEVTIKGIEIKCFYKGSTIEDLGYNYDYEKMKKWVDEYYKDKDRKTIERKYFNKLYDV